VPNNTIMEMGNWSPVSPELGATAPCSPVSNAADLISGRPAFPSAHGAQDLLHETALFGVKLVDADAYNPPIAPVLAVDAPLLRGGAPGSVGSTWVASRHGVK
jgi:hypothetical protein